MKKKNIFFILDWDFTLLWSEVAFELINKEFMINETAALITFDFKKDEVEIDKHIGSFSGTINEMIFVFSIVDIIQISPRSEFEIKIYLDPLLLLKAGESVD